MSKDSYDLKSIQGVDWRKTLKKNQFRTFIVIGLFFLIYTGVGLLIDLFFASENYPNYDLLVLFIALVTFKIFPTITLIMFGVAAISLLVSYALYDKLMLLGTNAREITAQSAKTIEEKQFYNTVEEMKIAAGLRYMPKVYIIRADYMNAFASGYSEKSAMIAITDGLMKKLNRAELQAVVAHELTHIQHLDIKLTLTASLLANITIIVLDFFFFRAIFSSNKGKGDNKIAGILIVLRYVMPLITILLLLYLSRTREMMADAGAVKLTRNNQPLASALIKINKDYTIHKDHYNEELKHTRNEEVRRQAYLFDPLQAGIKGAESLESLFSTHPSLEKRLSALGVQKS